MRIAPITNNYQNNRIRQRSNTSSSVSFQASGNNYSNAVLKFLQETLSPKMFADLETVDNPKVFSLTASSQIADDSPRFLNNLIGPLPEHFFEAISKAQQSLLSGQSGFCRSYKIEKLDVTSPQGDKQVVRVSRPFFPNYKTRINMACDVESGANDKMTFQIGDFD